MCFIIKLQTIFITKYQAGGTKINMMLLLILLILSLVPFNPTTIYVGFHALSITQRLPNNNFLMRPFSSCPAASLPSQ